MEDDREKFEAQKKVYIDALGQNTKVFDKSKELILELDDYKYSYLWSWFGLPIIQFPADVMATQEAIWKSKPNLIIESGVARGGSLIFLSSILEAMGGGKVVGIDVEIRKHNLSSINQHPLKKNIELVEGSSTDQSTIEKVQTFIKNDSRVMVILDSDHSFDHVYEELKCYAPLVTSGCYLVVADTLVGFLSEDETPKDRSKLWYKGNEPLSALNKFLHENADFYLDEEINNKLVLSSSPGGYCVKV